MLASLRKSRLDINIHSAPSLTKLNVVDGFEIKDSKPWKSLRKFVNYILIILFITHIAKNQFIARNDPIYKNNRRCDRIVIGFTSTCAIKTYTTNLVGTFSVSVITSSYHHGNSCEFVLYLI